MPTNYFNIGGILWVGKILSKLLPEIDRVATQENVEREIAKYRLYCFSVPEEKLPKVTASFSLVPPSNTNGFHSSTEEIAIERVDEQRKKNPTSSIFEGL